MARIMMLSGVAAISIAAGIAYSRSKETSAIPPDLRAGLYEVAVGGGTLIRSRSGRIVDDVCINETQAAYFPTDPLDPVVTPWPGCSSVLDEPFANTMSGSRSCPARKVPMTATYSGRHTADSFEIDGSVTQGNQESSYAMHLGSGAFRIIGKRIGDCPG